MKGMLKSMKLMNEELENSSARTRLPSESWLDAAHPTLSGEDVELASGEASSMRVGAGCSASPSTATSLWEQGRRRPPPPWDMDKTVGILQGLKRKFEKHHGVRILDSTLVAVAQRAARYITSTIANFLTKQLILLTRLVPPQVCKLMTKEKR
ncbi:hypothetical protein EJB05_07092, partial [Eragrostis curvula]